MFLGARAGGDVAVDAPRRAGRAARPGRRLEHMPCVGYKDRSPICDRSHLLKLDSPTAPGGACAVTSSFPWGRERYHPRLESVHREVPWEVEVVRNPFPNQGGGFFCVFGLQGPSAGPRDRQERLGTRTRSRERSPDLWGPTLQKNDVECQGRKIQRPDVLIF